MTESLRFDAGQNEQGRPYPEFVLEGLTKAQVRTILTTHASIPGTGSDDEKLVIKDGCVKFEGPQALTGGTAEVILIEVNGEKYRACGKGTVIDPQGRILKVIP